MEKENKKLPFNIQLFAEEKIEDGKGDGEITPDPEKAKVLSLTDEELEKLVKERATELTNEVVRERLKKEKLKHEEDKQKAIEEAVRKAQLSDEEKEKEEVTELRNKVSELTELIDSSKRSEIVKSKFATKNIPYTDEMVKVLAKDLDNVDSVIEGMESKINELVSAQVSEKLKNSSSNLPNTPNTPAKRSARYQTTISKIGV